MHKRIAVLGLDGLSRDLLIYHIKHRYISTLSKIKDENLLINDMKCIPPLTFPSWTNLLTGTNPGYHNIFDFFEYKIINNTTRELKVIDATYLKHPRIHEMAYLSNSSIKSFLVNIVP